MYVTEAMIASMEDMMRNAGDMEKHIKAMMETEARGEIPMRSKIGWTEAIIRRPKPAALGTHNESN